VVKFNNPYTVLTPIVKVGENLKYQQDSVKFFEVLATLNCSFEDGIVYSLPSRVSNLATGIHNSIVEVTIPKTLPPGDYVYKCVVTYEILKIRQVRYEFYTNMFSVVD